MGIAGWLWVVGIEGWCQWLGIRYWVSGVRYEVLGTRSLVSGVGYRGGENQGLGIGDWLSGIGFWGLDFPWSSVMCLSPHYFEKKAVENCMWLLHFLSCMQKGCKPFFYTA